MSHRSWLHESVCLNLLFNAIKNRNMLHLASLCLTVTAVSCRDTVGHVTATPRTGTLTIGSSPLRYGEEGAVSS